MKKLLLITLSLLCTTMMRADTLAEFVERHPGAIDFNIISEGTTLNLSADDDDMLIHLSVAHPALQMRFLMQRLTIYADPSGKKKRNYEVKLPCAMDVREELDTTAVKPSAEQRSELRPDIRPLIYALQHKGADFLFGDSTQHLDFKRFHIEYDTEKEILNFYVMLPKCILMRDRKLSDKWSVGVFSLNDIDMMPTPGQEEDGAMMPPPADDNTQQDIMKLMQSDIREWTTFSIDDVNNIGIESDNVYADAQRDGETLLLSISVRQIETQLTFLMQGLNISIAQQDTVTISFPSAAMVRHKVKHHPNEVKAVLVTDREAQSGHNDGNHVVRPDVQPLVAALCDTTATITCGNTTTQTKNYSISVNREKAIMKFTISLNMNQNAIIGNKLHLALSSNPIVKGDMTEFDGKRLSSENAPNPDGLGEGIRKKDFEERTFHKDIYVNIQQDKVY